jgi:arginine N-succinyltransferase
MIDHHHFMNNKLFFAGTSKLLRHNIVCCRLPSAKEEDISLEDENLTSTTHVFRPATTKDVQAVYELAKLTGGGFTNLPADRDAIAAKLRRAEEAIVREGNEIGEDMFFFVLEEIATGDIHGTSLIFSRIGDFWPFYSYRIDTPSQRNEQLDKTIRNAVLMPSNDMNGATEVGGLFLHPAARAGGFGMLLARGRYLFMRRHRSRFAEQTFADLRGVSDDAGTSPFWDAIGRHFFDMDFADADTFNGIHGNQFISDLMPKHPIYVAMLPEAARLVIGRPHPSGQAALRMLLDEGFTTGRYIDIFDAGPTVVCRTEEIASIRNARESRIAAINADAVSGGDPVKHLISTGYLRDFRLGYGMIVEQQGGLILSPDTAEALRLSVGDIVTHVERR